MRTDASPRLPPTSCAEGGAAAAGMSAMSDSVLLAVGTMLNSSVVMTFCCVTFVTSTSGETPDTVNVSESLADLELAVHRGGEVRRELQSLLDQRRETGERERDGIHARPQFDDSDIGRARR